MSTFNNYPDDPPSSWTKVDWNNPRTSAAQKEFEKQEYEEWLNTPKEYKSVFDPYEKTPNKNMDNVKTTLHGEGGKIINETANPLGVVNKNADNFKVSFSDSTVQKKLDKILWKGGKITPPVTNEQVINQLKEMAESFKGMVIDEKQWSHGDIYEEGTLKEISKELKPKNISEEQRLRKEFIKKSAECDIKTGDWVVVKRLPKDFENGWRFRQQTEPHSLMALQKGVKFKVTSVDGSSGHFIQDIRPKVGKEGRLQSYFPYFVLRKVKPPKQGRFPIQIKFNNKTDKPLEEIKDKKRGVLIDDLTNPVLSNSVIGEHGF